MSETEELPRVPVACAIIVDGQGHLLAARRAEGMDGWEFPGGKVERGETSEEACRREVLEELDCALGPLWFLDTVEFDYPTFHLSMDCFVCTLAPGSTPRRHVHSELRWLGRGELDEVEWLPADRALVRRLGASWDQVMMREEL